MAEIVSIDREMKLEYFLSTKAGVKGLVDSGITKIPKMFIHPKEERPEFSESEMDLASALEIPIIDLTYMNDKLGHREIIDKVYKASSSFGFFQLVNHGIPQSILDAVLEGTRAFHEGDLETKSNFYSSDQSRKVRYSSNPGLYKSNFGTWHDSFLCDFDESLKVNEIPIICREAVIEYKQHLLNLSAKICELLSESLGLKKDHLGSTNAAKKQVVVCHYYPPCPEPELTIGTQKHKDPSFLTILLQDSIGGFQIHYQGRWINVSPVPGALMVNVGDFLQLVSNDKLKSVEHRVLANKTKVARVSVATFFNPKDEEKPYGPMKELLLENNRPIYKEVCFRDYVRQLQSGGISTNFLNNFKL